MLAQPVAAHRANLPWANAGSVFAACLFVVTQWRAVVANALLSWLALLAVVLVLHTLLSSVAPKVEGEVPLRRAWLWRFRVAFLLRGLAWGLTSLLLQQSGDPLHRAVLVVVLCGVTASAFVLSAFDLTAVLCFGVPVLGMLSLRLFGQPEPTLWALGVAVIGVLIFMGLVARRAQGLVRSSVACTPRWPR